MTRQPIVTDMVTEARAERVALALFPGEHHDGTDCGSDPEGAPCRICEAQRADWLRRVAEVRAAMVAAFS